MNGNLARVGVAILALSTASTLAIVWGVGSQLAHDWVSFGDALPAPTQLAKDARIVMSVVVAALFVLGFLLSRTPGAAAILTVLGLIQVLVAVLYGFAWSIPYVPR